MQCRCVLCEQFEADTWQTLFVLDCEGTRCDVPANLATHHRSAFRAAESAHEIDDQGDQQNQPERAAADDRAANIKAATAEQQKYNHQE